MQKNNKKIALFSCHSDPNYGSMLQAYALAAAINKLGRNAEYINYTTLPKPTLVRRIKKTIRTILAWLGYNKRRGEFDFLRTRPFKKIMAAFSDFHKKYIPVSSELYYSSEVSSTFDVTKYSIYIIGSDQLWSPYLYNNQRPYFLDWADFPNRNSYATSFGTTHFSSDYTSLLVNKLSQFDNISCREKTNCNTLSEKLGQEVTHVLDPTLLLQADDWNKIAISSDLGKPYILAYILGEKDSIIQFAERLGREKDLPVYYILTRPKYLDIKNVLNDVGPAEFLGLVRDAAYIVTDSFHGSLFSINYQRNFYAFSKRDGLVNQNDNIRIVEFLTQLGLQARFQDVESAKCLPDIDYKRVNFSIEQLRNMSYSYLKKIV